VERIELLARAGDRAIASGYVQSSVTAGEYRIYPSRASRDRWIGSGQRVRFVDGREVVLVVTESRTRQVTWVTGREA
jgi:hypothetical protein